MAIANTDAEAGTDLPEKGSANTDAEAGKTKRGRNKVANKLLAGQSVAGRFDEEIVFDEKGIAEVSAEEKQRLVSIPGFEDA